MSSHAAVVATPGVAGWPGLPGPPGSLDPGLETPTSVPPDLEWLLERAATGDEQAFAMVYDVTSARVFGLAHRVLADRAQAEEVTQEAYLHIWLHSGRFDPGRGSALSWMMMIVHGRAVDRVRSVEASRRREADARVVATPRRPTAEDTTHEVVHGSFEAQRVRDALDGLSEVQRRSIVMAYFGGLTHVEVATETGVPLGTAKARIRSGLHALRDAMGERP